MSLEGKSTPGKKQSIPKVEKKKKNATKEVGNYPKIEEFVNFFNSKYSKTKK